VRLTKENLLQEEARLLEDLSSSEEWIMHTTPQFRSFAKLGIRITIDKINRALSQMKMFCELLDKYHKERIKINMIHDFCKIQI